MLECDPGNLFEQVWNMFLKFGFLQIESGGFVKKKTDLTP